MTSSANDHRPQRARRAPASPAPRVRRPGRPSLHTLPPLAVALSALALISCVGAAGRPGAAGQSGGRSSAGQPTSPTADASGPAGSPPAATSPAALPSLTPAQKAGQRVIYSYSGLEPPATLLSWIRHGQVGGVIFFGGNISSRAQIAGVIKQLDQANASASNPLRAVPLLLMTDQEGGAVRRLPGAAGAVGEADRRVGPPGGGREGRGHRRRAEPGRRRHERQPGAGAGRLPHGGRLRRPVRPFLQHQPHVVSALGADFIKAQQATGVAATAKHFPGLGAATNPGHRRARR